MDISTCSIRGGLAVAVVVTGHITILTRVSHLLVFHQGGRLVSQSQRFRLKRTGHKASWLVATLVWLIR